VFIGSEAPKWNFGQSLVQCPPTSLAGGTTSRLITWHGGGAGGLACSTHVEARPRDATALIGRSEGHPGRSALPIAAVGLEGSCLGPYESDVPAEAQWWCVDLLGRAGGASVGPLGPPVSPSIAQYRPVFAQRVSSLDLARYVALVARHPAPPSVQHTATNWHMSSFNKFSVMC
jgi:hypothetical protein